MTHVYNTNDSDGDRDDNGDVRTQMIVVMMMIVMMMMMTMMMIMMMTMMMFDKYIVARLTGAIQCYSLHFYFCGL